MVGSGSSRLAGASQAPPLHPPKAGGLQAPNLHITKALASPEIKMSIPMTQLGSRAFHHEDNAEVERQYDHLRDLARAEADKRGDCFERSRRAYEDGDGARAKELSNQGKAHDAKMKEYNRQASDYIFRENNAPGRVDADSIDLHGQFAEEAERILEQRIRADQARGQTHLHVIVGKGNHSANHVQRLKPKVEELCRELGLRYSTEDNAGRIYINLQGGEPVPPSHGGYGGDDYTPHQQHGDHHRPEHRPEHRPPQHQQQHQQDESAEDEGLLPLLLRKLEKACCAVM
ncbi:smr domain [Trichoderma arundinaceum]|uniref:Smr domain n=1 Tax=Trichoderma arundinaceum TaxID=490622 RepID=A0A395NSU6_TRIAR|nr:smr domain [Trichoderma arundinaceum]